MFRNAYLECTGTSVEGDRTVRHHKFYKVSVVERVAGQTVLLSQWGAIGTRAPGQQVKAMGPLEEIERLARKLVESKQKRGYAVLFQE